MSSGPELHIKTSEDAPGPTGLLLSYQWYLFPWTDCAPVPMFLIIMNIDILLMLKLMFSVYVASIACLSIPGRGRGSTHLWLSFSFSFRLKFFLTWVEGLRAEGVKPGKQWLWFWTLNKLDFFKFDMFSDLMKVPNLEGTGWPIAAETTGHQQRQQVTTPREYRKKFTYFYVNAPFLHYSLPTCSLFYLILFL